MNEEILHEHWMQLISGNKIDFLNPKPEQLDINCIARGLTFESRFGGQTRFFFSVAQHSINMCKIAPIGLELEHLLHDFSEGLGFKDLPGPLKRLLQLTYKAETSLNGVESFWGGSGSINTYKSLENRMLEVGKVVFQLSTNDDDWKIVKENDRRMAITEELVLMPNQLYHFTEQCDLTPFDYAEISLRPFKEVEEEFLELYEVYRRD